MLTAFVSCMEVSSWQLLECLSLCCNKCSTKIHHMNVLVHQETKLDALPLQSELRRSAERQVRESSVPGAGRGVFCRAAVPSETVLGAYPGHVRLPAQVLAKVGCCVFCIVSPFALDLVVCLQVGRCRKQTDVLSLGVLASNRSWLVESVCDVQVSTAPRTKDYVLLIPDLSQPRYLDPTDASGRPSARPSPGLPWPMPSDPTLAYINEPPARGDVNVRFGDAHRADPLEVRFVAARALEAGEGALGGMGCCLMCFQLTCSGDSTPCQGLGSMCMIKSCHICKR